MREHIDELLMLLISALFGFSYSVQSIGAQYLSPFSFSFGKNAISIIALLIIFAFRKKKFTNVKKTILFAAIIAVDLTVFTYLQQVVAVQNTPGKTGFITTMYIVEVPLINYIFFGKKISRQVLLSLVFAVAGLVLLCDLTTFNVNLYDILTLICSLCLCIQIILLGRYCSDIDPIEFNIFVSLFIMVFSLVGALLSKETISLIAYKQAIWPLLYVGVGCAALGVSIQVYAQKTLDETTSSLILSLESLFSVFAGYLLLDASLSKMELIGCLLMFIAVVMCVTADRKKKE